MNESNFNFNDLYNKIKAIGESPMTDDRDVEECGDMPAKVAAPGMAGDDEILVGGKDDIAGGPQVSIRSLIAALSAIEQGSSQGHDEIEFGEEQHTGGFDDATTRPEEDTFDVNFMTRTGNDLASKGAEAHKVNGGGNPMQEALLRRLSAHYNEVKAR